MACTEWRYDSRTLLVTRFAARRVGNRAGVRLERRDAQDPRSSYLASIIPCGRHSCRLGRSISGKGKKDELEQRSARLVAKRHQGRPRGASRKGFWVSSNLDSSRSYVTIADLASLPFVAMGVGRT